MSYNLELLVCANLKLNLIEKQMSFQQNSTNFGLKEGKVLQILRHTSMVFYFTCNPARQKARNESKTLPIATSDITNILNASFAKKIAHELSVLFSSVSASTNVEFPNFCSLAISVLIWHTTCSHAEGSCSICSIHHLGTKTTFFSAKFRPKNYTLSPLSRRLNALKYFVLVCLCHFRFILFSKNPVSHKFSACYNKFYANVCIN